MASDLDLRIEKVTKDGNGVEENIERARVLLVLGHRRRDRKPSVERRPEIGPPLPIIGYFAWKKPPAIFEMILSPHL